MGREKEKVAGVEERPAVTRTGGRVVQTKGRKRPKLSSKGTAEEDLRKDGMGESVREEMRNRPGRGKVGARVEREGMKVLDKHKDSEELAAACGEESVVKESEMDTQSVAICNHLKKNPTVEVSRLKLTPRTMSKRLLKFRLRARRKDLARVEVKGDEEMARVEVKGDEEVARVEVKGDEEVNREPQEIGAEEGGEREGGRSEEVAPGNREAQGIGAEEEGEGSASRAQRELEDSDGESEEISIQSQGMVAQKDGENTGMDRVTGMLQMRDMGADGIVEQSIAAPACADNTSCSLNIKPSHRTSTGCAGSTSAHRTSSASGKSSTSEGKKDRRKTLLGEAVVRALKKHGMPRAHQHFRDCYNKLYKIGKTFMEVRESF